MNQRQSLVGHVIGGRYHVDAPLGAGGMGAIYLATQRPLGRRVVLKVLLEAFMSDETASRRFEKEALSISRIVHPHIVTLYDFGRTPQGEMYIAMEYLPGLTLREVLMREQRLPAGRAARIVEGVAQGLAEAHRHGIIHRDLKPENVMLVRAGEDHDFPKILDFGLAHGVETPMEKDGQRLTQQNMIPGTPCYVSPERALGQGEDPRSDLYSLGAMWYELVTGDPPLQGENAVKTIVAQIQEQPIPPRRRLPGLPLPDVHEALIMALLQKRPEDRPVSAPALVRELKEADVDEHWGASSPGIPRLLTSPPALSEWADDASEIPDINFGSFLGLDDEPVLLTNRKQKKPSQETEVPPELSVEDTPSTPPGFRNTLVGIKAIDPEPEASLPPQDTEEVDAILLDSPKTPAPLADRNIDSVAEAASEMARARTLDEVCQVIVAYTRSRFDRAVVIDLLSAPPVARARTGYGRYTDVVGTLLRTHGFGKLVERSEPFYGPPPRTFEWRETFEGLGGDRPGAILCAVLRRAGRAALVIFADHKSETLHAALDDVTQLLREAAACLSVLER